MNGYLIDTNAISELARPSPSLQVQQWFRQAAPDTLFVSAITVGEIRLGIESLPASKRRNDLEIWFDTGLPGWFASNLVPITRTIADRWGRLTIQAKRKGNTLATADGLIAATAFEYDLTLVTRNRKDLEDLGLTILDPWQIRKS
jgi:predicted nucleic acid-binding protein